MRVRELAEWLGTTFEGDGEKEITGVGSLESAGVADMAFASGRKGVTQALQSAAGCLAVPEDYANAQGRTIVRARDPRAAFARVAGLFHPPPPVEPGVHPTAVVGAGAVLGEAVSIGPHVAIGDGARIGARTRVAAGCTIGRQVSLGDDCVLHPRVSIYDNVDIGHRVILHSGCVIGADGFGFVMAGDHYEKFPQIGRVSIGDDVEIGANSCVDRGRFGKTRIGRGTKIDNLVQIGHNVVIGDRCIICGGCGIAGSTVVGDNVTIAGQVGIAGHLTIGDNAVIGAQAGVAHDVPAGAGVLGAPAVDHRQYKRMLVALQRLPDLLARIRELEKQLAAPR